jgi:penicillin-binding protein 1C
VAEKARTKQYESLALTLANKVADSLKATFYFIGKPLYVILFTGALVITYVCYITGHLILTLFSSFQTLLFVLLNITKKILAAIRKQFLTSRKQFTPQVKRVVIKSRVLFQNSYYVFKKINSGVSDFLALLFLRVKFFLFRVAAIQIPLPRIKIKYTLLIIVLLILIISPVISGYIIVADLPSPHNLITRKIDVSTKIYDRNGILLYKIYKNENRTIKRLEEIPQHVQKATLAAEDAEFYSHRGISLRGITRAIYKYIKEDEITGGSTITQQLIKNTLLTPEKTLTRKVREVILAVWVENVYTKDQILEMYLNEVSYGGTAYGIEEASEEYLGKTVSDLTIAEAALLAGLPKSPTRFSPFGPNQEAALARQKDVLHLMKVNGFLTSEEQKTAEEEKINFITHAVNIKAPHFVMYVRELLEDKFGKDVVETGGLEVITTLDYEVQKIAERAVMDELTKLKNLNVGNAAVIVTHPQTGEILAMVGSLNYFDTDNGGNVNVTTALRQPGSSIKVVNYAYALSHGYTPASMLADTPITYKIAGLPPYTPKNYDGGFRGNLTLRSALAESRNIPAVKVLASYGVANMIEMGKKMGITTWEEKDRFGLSLTLGGGEVKLVELAQVYSTLANYGKRQDLSSLLSVKNYQKVKLYQNACTEKLNSQKSCTPTEVLDPRVAFTLTDILKDNKARTAAFGGISQLVISGHPEVAVKTGTSNNLKDNLTIGYTQKYTVAVWVGNNDGTPMSRVASGVTGASPIFNKIMSTLLANEPVSEWLVPAGIEKLAICSYTGTLPCNGCPLKTEWFLEEFKPKSACSPQYVEELKEKQQKREG